MKNVRIVLHLWRSYPDVIGSGIKAQSGHGNVSGNPPALMAMKKILLIILLGVSMSGYAQRGALYFSLTPQEGVQPQNQTEGICKSVDRDSNPLYRSESIFFYLKSKSRDIDITFAHINYNTAEMVRQNLLPKWDCTMEITTTGNNIASTHTIYNLDSYLKAYTRQQLIDWFNSLGVNDKKIYFFDQRDLAKGKVTLIQVKLLDYGGW